MLEHAAFCLLSYSLWFLIPSVCTVAPLSPHKVLHLSNIFWEDVAQIINHCGKNHFLPQFLGISQEWQWPAQSLSLNTSSFSECAFIYYRYLICHFSAHSCCFLVFFLNSLVSIFILPILKYFLPSSDLIISLLTYFSTHILGQTSHWQWPSLNAKNLTLFGHKLCYSFFNLFLIQIIRSLLCWDHLMALKALAEGFCQRFFGKQRQYQSDDC